MADDIGVVVYRRRQMRLRRRDALFRDRTNPLEKFDDVELFTKFRFRREFILQLTNQLEPELKTEKRYYTAPPCLQVLIVLKYLASNTLMDTTGELFGVDKSTVSRVVSRLLKILHRRASRAVCFHDVDTAKQTVKTIYNKWGIPNIVGFIDGTLIKIARPHKDEEVYVGRKRHHAINVQVM